MFLLFFVGDMSVLCLVIISSDFVMTIICIVLRLLLRKVINYLELIILLTDYHINNFCIIESNSTNFKKYIKKSQ